MGHLGFNMLPEDCVSAILSLTSPSDACRSSAVSSVFKSAAECDTVWERFLPSDYQDIVSRSDSPLHYASKKQLFFILCNSVSIDGGNKIFTLEKSSGRKSYILSAKDLSIVWADVPMYWSWKSIPESRFAQVAELRSTYWLEIHCKVKTLMLSPNTNYGAYLIFNVSERSYGIDTMPVETCIKVDHQVCYNTAFLRQSDSNKQQIEELMYVNRTLMLVSRVNQGDWRVPRGREDGWLEVELGQFFSGDGDEEVKMSLMEVKGCHLKGGLIIEGIEVRPVWC
ncbi:hypothetical protein Ancab_000687 [Ancistrocladus abbreviatus]